jgi:hypothetical protein
MSEPKIIYNPATIAECGGPCEQGPEYCDCGELRINCPDISMTKHPLTEADQAILPCPFCNGEASFTTKSERLGYDGYSWFAELL